MTNNSLESLHHNLKLTYTQNQKLSTPAFLQEALRIVRDYSDKISKCTWMLNPPAKSLWKKAKFLISQNLYREKDDRLFFIRSCRDSTKLAGRFR